MNRSVSLGSRSGPSVPRHPVDFSPSLARICYGESDDLYRQAQEIGGSVGAILPKDMLQRQHLSANDEVFITETADGILLTAADPATKVALEAYAEGARENRAALAALSKL